MAALDPVSHREVVSRLRRLGFEGPYGGGKHPIMVRGQLRLVIPNVHGDEIGVALLSRILKRAGISSDEWNAVH
jgi:predicted RNA binding protein YcfA (HicA-like mRNA interferase family)